MKVYIVMESVYNTNGHLSTEPIGVYKKHQSALSKLEEIYWKYKKYDTKDIPDDGFPVNVSFCDLYDDKLRLEIDEEVYMYEIKTLELKN